MPNRLRREFGDFQTPYELAYKACKIISHLDVGAIIEPTCGQGSFLFAAARRFPDAKPILGFEINQDYLDQARENIGNISSQITLKRADFFSEDWHSVIHESRGPWLIIGNPPWVTNAELGGLGSKNIPEKSNFHGRSGFDSISGKANFDISEWMILKYLEWLEGKTGTIAVLCKTAVARKILLHAWKQNLPCERARFYKINAIQEFGASVDACFFVLPVGRTGEKMCEFFGSLENSSPDFVFGYDDGKIVSDIDLYGRFKHLGGADPKYVWRSGIKHDCSQVMELQYEGLTLKNALAERVDLEQEYAFPMLKSSDIGNGRVSPRGEMVVPQRFVGQSTDELEKKAPLLWAYLNDKAPFLDRRGSVIYKKNPRFSVFGVGGYTFAPWKVAISGFYKKLTFTVVPPVDGRPVVFDDTVYFLSCSSEQEAHFIERLLNSDIAQRFYSSLVHWDEKRPITVSLLKQLSLRKVAEQLGEQETYSKFMGSLAFA